MNIAAAVILFYPEEKTIDNLLSYSSFVHTLYVLDNSENPSIEIVELLKKIPNCQYIHDDENKGIAKRLNQACKLAIANNFDWLLTMDQDSSFSQKNISAYINCLESLANKKQIAMTGAEFIKKENGEVNCAYTEVTSLITSGSIMNLTLFNEIGVFDEALFIDQVDFEYCIRAVSNGYKVLHFSNIFLEHSLGVVSVHRSFKNLKNTYRSLHSPLRIYYMTRNYLYLKPKYEKSFPFEISIIKKDLFIRLKNNLIYNKKRNLVIIFFIRGIIDYKRNKMGKIGNQVSKDK